MSEVEAIETRIRDLPSHDLAEFRDWFYEFEDGLWDQQIKSDFQAGKFNKLIKKARVEFAEGKAREI